MRRKRYSTHATGDQLSNHDAREDFDLHAATYEEAVDRSISFTGRDSAFFAKRKMELLRRILATRGHDLSQAAVLDVGCGTGTTDRYLVSQVRTLHGVDLAPQMLNEARRNVPDAQFSQYDGRTLPFASDSFDVVIAICVLHHVPVPDQPRFLAEIHRVTVPGGLIAIFEHNPNNPLTRRAVRGCELDLGVILLSAGDVERLLADVGAGLVGHEYILFTPLGGRLGATVDRWFRRIPLGGQHVVLAAASESIPS
jgi:ubiquinone/menaquinone biosynthesis C-methylase UbiE